MNSPAEERKFDIRTRKDRFGGWFAFEGEWKSGDYRGYGHTEADAVYDLFCAINEREQDDQERHDTEMGVQS
jgi:hypothetical protein